MGQILVSTNKILQMVDSVFLRLYILCWAVFLLSFSPSSLFFVLPLIFIFHQWLCLKIAIEQLDAVVKELYNRSGNKWPLVVLHNKRLRALLENPSHRKLVEEWMDKGVLYMTPTGSNDDWYIPLNECYSLGLWCILCCRFLLKIIYA